MTDQKADNHNRRRMVGVRLWPVSAIVKASPVGVAKVDQVRSIVRKGLNHELIAPLLVLSGLAYQTMEVPYSLDVENVTKKN